MMVFRKEWGKTWFIYYVKELFHSFHENILKTLRQRIVPLISCKYFKNKMRSLNKLHHLIDRKTSNTNNENENKIRLAIFSSKL